MKKILSALLAAVMLFGTVSCNKNSPDPGPETERETTSTVSPEPVQPDTPETTVPEPSSPETPEPETLTPGPNTPGTPKPDTTTPGTNTPGTPKPDTTTPDTDTEEPPKQDTSSSGTVTEEPPKQDTSSSGTVTEEPPKQDTSSSGTVTEEPPKQDTSSSGTVTEEPPKQDTSSSGAVTAKPLVITSHPQDVEAAAGETVVFRVAASGGSTPYTYKWMLKEKTSSWRTASGGTKDTLERVFTTSELDSGLEFRCEITDSTGGQIVSNAAKVTKKAASVVPETPAVPEFPTIPEVPGIPEVPDVPMAPEVPIEPVLPITPVKPVTPEKPVTGLTDKPLPLKITVQPVDAAGRTGEQVTFSVTVSGGKSPYSYCWEGQNGPLRGWNPLVGGYFSELTMTVPEESGDVFRCVITDSAGNEVISNEVTITVLADLPEKPGIITKPDVVLRPARNLTITSHPQYTEVQDGMQVVYRVAAEGGQSPYTYQWQAYQSLAGQKPMWWDLASSGDRWTGADTDELTWTAKESDGTDQIRVRCIITDAAGTSVTSAEVQIMKKPENNIVTGNRPTTGISPVRNLSITSQPQYTESAAAGTQVVYHVAAAGGEKPYTYQWQAYQSLAGGSPMWWDLASDGDRWEGADTDTLAWTVKAGDGTEPVKVRCIITDVRGTSVTSEEVQCPEAKIVRPSGTGSGVRPVRQLAITTQPQYVAGFDGVQVVYRVAASGGTTPYTYQWQAYQSVAGGSPMWWDLASDGDRWEGADTAEFTWTVLESDRETQVRIRCIITDASGNSVTSDEIPILK